MKQIFFVLAFTIITTTTFAQKYKFFYTSNKNNGIKNIDVGLNKIRNSGDTSEIHSFHITIKKVEKNNKEKPANRKFKKRNLNLKRNKKPEKPFYVKNKKKRKKNKGPLCAAYGTFGKPKRKPLGHNIRMFLNKGR